jgi:hypothetical protein
MTHEPDPILLNLSVFELVWTCLQGEARGEPIEGQAAVANVLRNRLRTGRWGETYHNVILAWAQFSCMWPTLGGGNYNGVLSFAKMIRAPETHTRSDRQLRLITEGLFSDSLLDETKGATHYHADWIQAPAWAKPPAVRTAVIGKHSFWRNVR